jgi:hypothetical protein
MPVYGGIPAVFFMSAVVALFPLILISGYFICCGFIIALQH